MGIHEELPILYAAGLSDHTLWFAALSWHQTKAGQQVTGTFCTPHLGDTQNPRVLGVKCRNSGRCVFWKGGRRGRALFIKERYMPAQATGERSSFQPVRGNLAEQKTCSRKSIKGIQSESDCRWS